MIEKKIPEAMNKVVKKVEKGIAINLDGLASGQSDEDDFTTLMSPEIYELLSDPQKKALKKIKEYWEKRIKNSENWRRSRHFGYSKETISARIDDKTFYLIKNKNINQVIQNFIRFFLRNKEFRLNYKEKLREQYKADLNSTMGKLSEYDNDHTGFMQKMKKLYPILVSGEFYTLEKELYFFYCYYFTSFSISYNLRCGLLFNYSIEQQKPIDRWEVETILEEMLAERNLDEFSIEKEDYEFILRLANDRFSPNRILIKHGEREKLKKIEKKYSEGI